MEFRVAVLLPAACAGFLSVAAVAQPVEPAERCNLLAQPALYTSDGQLQRRAAYETTLEFSRAMGPATTPARNVAASQVKRRNFVDDEIFRTLAEAGLPAAAQSSDTEFFRRVTLDLTGRLPSAADVRAFVSDSSPDKRDTLIDRLLFSPEFVDKWTQWLGDILQNAASAQNRSQQVEGRNRLHEYIRAAIDSGKSWRDIAFELVAATGNNYDGTTAGTNFILRGYAPMGPAQDTYDMTLVKTASVFLGLGHYDCLLCHNGKRHLDSISVWGAASTRLEAQRMAAHFARTSLSSYPTTDRSSYYYNSTFVLNRASGTYDLNTNYGNRPNRNPATIDGQSVVNLTPVYRDGTAASGAWRESLARAMIADPMFARNFANRVWKAVFNLGLVEPVDQLDPARLDPATPPPAGWVLQASHPQLLEKLAQYARDNDYNLRETLRLLVSSSAYQLSSSYDSDWDLTRAPLQARHLPRRLAAEEIHDAITKATGLLPSYTVGGWALKVNWAMQLPEPVEPRSDGTAAAFMNAFNRGNRDTLQRSQSGSILMWLSMMNSTLVTSRTRATGANASPYLSALLAQKNDDTVIDDMFLTFLTRAPGDYERGIARHTLANATSAGSSRAAAIEDLAWALINKIDFLYSY